MACVLAAAAPAKSLHLCLTLCDPIDGSPPGSPVTGFLQARTLEWVAISFSKSCPILCDLMDCACQAPLSMEISRQEYWSELPFSPPGDLPHPGIEPESLASPALAGRFFTTGATLESLL